MDGVEQGRVGMVKCDLSDAAIGRYGRQLIMEDIGVDGQRKLLGSRVAVVGAGGLGSPVLLYLAAAGVGHLTVVDADVVDVGNLHRQIVHSSRMEGKPKVLSAQERLKDLNEDVTVSVVQERLGRNNAKGILEDHDVVVDCTDNAATRYLVNDVCCLLGVPLVFGSALQSYGQASVFHAPLPRDGECDGAGGSGSGGGDGHWKGEVRGPCYRCVFPVPPPAASVGTCSDNGVWGPVLGVIGSVQAMETLKLLLGPRHRSSLMAGLMLFVDLLGPSFRRARLRPRNPACPACGDEPSISFPDLVDYEAFCGVADACEGAAAAPPELAAEVKGAGMEVAGNGQGEGAAGRRHGVQEMSCRQYAETLAKEPHVLVDVRPAVQFAICALDGAHNFPLSSLSASLEEVRALTDGALPLAVMCRRGIDSVTAASQLRAAGFPNVINIRGGLTRWHFTVDESMPLY